MQNHVTVSKVTRATAPGAGPPDHHCDLTATSQRFVNPWPSAKLLHEGIPGPGWTLAKLVWAASRDRSQVKMPPPAELPKVVKPDWAYSTGSARPQDLKSTWLGHASNLIELPCPPGANRGLRVLFDPVFSDRCSPSTFMGPKRLTAPAVSVPELPHIDAVCISHNHYDHCDAATLGQLYRQQDPGSVVFFVPLGDADVLRGFGIDGDFIHELDWWDECQVEVKVQADGSTDGMRISCTPSQHLSGRSVMLRDMRRSLWGSWAVRHQPTGASVFFAGDTGYRGLPVFTPPDEEAQWPHCPAFKEIGDKLGPFSLGLVPIGAYSVGNRFCPQHATPEHAVSIHQDVQAKRSIGIHWGTWLLSGEPFLEPPARFVEAARKAGLSEGECATSDIGETVAIAVA